MISAAQVRQAPSLLGWAPPTLAESTLLSLNVIATAQDYINIRHLGGLQLGAIKGALEAGGIEFFCEKGSKDVLLRKIET